MARDVVRRDHVVAIAAGARAMGIDGPWAETICADAPPPNPKYWTDHRYPYSLAEWSPLDRRMRYQSVFLLEGKIIANSVDLRGAMDASVKSDSFGTQGRGR